jgi:hypothetical protein
MSAQQDEQISAVRAIVAEFVDVCDEYLVCIAFVVRGLEASTKALRGTPVTPGQQLWLASNADVNPEYHARMSMAKFLDKSQRDGHFTSEMTKSLLCTIYALWDETYRPKIAAVFGGKPSEIIAPLMGDLRQIRHCILHNKSVVPDGGLSFEVIPWALTPGRLALTVDQFRDFVVLVRTSLRIQRSYLHPAMRAIRDQMTAKEGKSFDDWYKVTQRKQGNQRWPGLDAVLQRLGVPDPATVPP